tara:strand:- start:2398 stop:2997 length:600 start_codon:yes stop_codon:yes gene_type:complete
MVIGGKSYEKYEFTSASKAILNEVIQKVKKFVDNVFELYIMVLVFTGDLYMEDKTNYDNYELVNLLKAKKDNLSQQAKLREESKVIDEAIANNAEVKEQIKSIHNSGGSKRVQLNGIIPKDLRVQFKVTKQWDQEQLHDLARCLNTFPFKTEFVEQVKESAKLKESDPKAWSQIEEALTTKINERPYISFIDPLKGGEE